MIYDERPWDWMLDGLAPLVGCLIGMSIFLAVMDCLG